jgi:hypothetical protein
MTASSCRRERQVIQQNKRHIGPIAGGRLI